MNRLRHSTGYTLVELVVATASAGVIVVGLSSSLFIAGQAIDVDNGASSRTLATERALGLLMSDVEHALEFKQRSATTLEFTVPDRDNDGRPESLCYSWTGEAGAPLVRSFNGGTKTTHLRDVRALDFVSLTRAVAAMDVTVSPDPKWPVVEDHTVSIIESQTKEVVLDTPLGVAEGELLIAVLVIDDIDVDLVITPEGWSVVALFQNEDLITLGVWAKTATDAEPSTHGWRLAVGESVVGGIVRISNQHESNPIAAVATDFGVSDTPAAPAAIAADDHSLVLRIGGFDKDTIDYDDPGLPGHELLMTDDAKIVCGVIGHKMQRAAGGARASLFQLIDPEEFCTATVVIAPRED